MLLLGRKPTGTYQNLQSQFWTRWLLFRLVSSMDELYAMPADGRERGYLDARLEEWHALYHERLAKADTPRDRLLAVFDSLCPATPS